MRNRLVKQMQKHNLKLMRCVASVCLPCQLIYLAALSSPLITLVENRARQGTTFANAWWKHCIWVTGLTVVGQSHFQCKLHSIIWEYLPNVSAPYAWRKTKAPFKKWRCCSGDTKCWKLSYTFWEEDNYKVKKKKTIWILLLLFLSILRLGAYCLWTVCCAKLYLLFLKSKMLKTISEFRDLWVWWRIHKWDICNRVAAGWEVVWQFQSQFLNCYTPATK